MATAQDDSDAECDGCGLPAEGHCQWVVLVQSQLRRLVRTLEQVGVAEAITAVIYQPPP